MTGITTRSRRFALALAAIVLSVGHGAATSTRQSVTRRIYVAVTDKAGVPVKDLRAADFEVREGGTVQEIDVRLAATPLRVALLVSDRGSGAFQGGALRFCEALLGHGEISITGIIVQPEKLVDYSSSGEALKRGLQQIGRRTATNQSGAELIDALLEAAKDIRREGMRPAIVVMRAGAEAPTSVRIDHIQGALRESGAVFYVVSTNRDDGSLNADVGRFGSGLFLPTVLNDSSRESGGRRIDVLGGTLVPTMQQIAAELIDRYEITYTLPAGTKPSGRIDVSSRRRDVAVRAPTRIAN